MLNDLEKRDAFLNENQDRVLDGLYSAYDVELAEKKKSHIPSLVLISLTIGIFLYTFTLFENEIINSIIDIEQSGTVITLPEQETIEIKNTVKINNDEIKKSAVNKISLNKEIETVNNKQDQLLQLDSSIVLKDDSESFVGNQVNRIESIQFEVERSGINLLMKMPNEIDYLVYGLSNPDRTVIEIENVELGFKLEELVPVEPIVAIRYSINESKRFKLVLESDMPLTIKKSTMNQSGGVHDLLVMMEYQWNRKETLVQEDIELVEIVEKQVTQEKNTVFKGDLIKSPVRKSADAYAEKLFQQAYIAYKKGNISESLKKLNMSLNQDAGHVRARSTLALVLSERKHFELAYSVLNEGLIQYPENIEWLKMYARLLLNEGKTTEASSMLTRQSPEFSSNTEYYALQAAILQKLNEHEEAARIYHNLLKLSPLKGVWWMGLGISLESLKRYNDALYAYQKASGNAALVKESREFILKRINRLNNILEDEST